MKQFWQYDDEHNRALGVLRAPGWTQGDLTPDPEIDLEVELGPLARARWEEAQVEARAARGTSPALAALNADIAREGTLTLDQRRYEILAGELFGGPKQAAFQDDLPSFITPAQQTALRDFEDRVETLRAQVVAAIHAERAAMSPEEVERFEGQRRRHHEARLSMAQLHAEIAAESGEAPPPIDEALPPFDDFAVTRAELSAPDPSGHPTLTLFGRGYWRGDIFMKITIRGDTLTVARD